MTKVSMWRQAGSKAWLGALAVAAALLHFNLLPVDATALRYDIRNAGKNRIDQGRMVQGYYQDLNQADAENHGGIANALAGAIVEGDDRPRGPARFSDSGATRKSAAGYLSYELIPGIEVQHLGVPIKVNRFGQRDRDYDLQKPPSTFRIAMVGASNSMGWGVRVEEAFPELVEERLNRELAGRGFERYELINFSVPGYSVVELLYVVEEIVSPFAPDLILVETCAEEIQWNTVDRVAMRFHRGFEVRYEFLQQIIDEAGVSRTDRRQRLLRRLMPAKQAINMGMYRYLGELSRTMKTPIALLLLRIEVAPRIHPLLDWSAEVAAEHGLIPLKVYQAFEDGDGQSMYLSEQGDHHPSAKAHALLADDIFEQLLQEPRTREMLLGGATKGNQGS